MTTLIQKWNNLGVLKKWKVVEEDTIGPSLREIVEQYIDERWPSDKKSDSFHGDSTIKKKDDAIDSLHKDVGVNSSSSTKEVEKTSESLPEGNMTTIFSAEGTEGDDYLKEVLRKVLREKEDMREILRKSLKEQEEMREALRKNLKEQEEMRDILEMIKKKVFEEEEDKGGEESSLQQYTTAKEKAKDEKEEQEEWSKLRDTLRSFNFSMDGIQAFQKFRFYCEPGYLPWPLPELT
ncbi:uncharacterized protein LOC131874796 [Cryptomeria japonica]|uniref:uncharacterized protein LOC131874796 n=1 Tax=Cryptomeria japonica TaxID=3369 RepID=UPI0027DA2693|nr:uncharacterized protein LOC131874796 [Cryptomeria japonica]